MCLLQTAMRSPIVCGQHTAIPPPAKYFTTSGMTEARVARAKPDCLIMHPGPINRGMEIASEVADGT